MAFQEAMVATAAAAAVAAELVVQGPLLMAVAAVAAAAVEPAELEVLLDMAAVDLLEYLFRAIQEEMLKTA